MPIKPDIRTKIGTLRLKTPVVCASGTFGYGVELRNLTDYSCLGAFITKTITLQERRGNKPPRIFETGAGVLNSIGLENPGVDSFISEYIPQIKKIPARCIVSIGGMNIDEYRQVLKKLESIKTVAAYEINLSCPNLQLKKMISQDPSATYRYIKSLRSLTRRTLIAKLTPEVDDITKVAAAAKRGGADALSLVNTFLGMAINIQTRRPYLGNIYGGYSGCAIKPLALYRVWKVSRSVDIAVIGGGGISSGADAIEFFLAGANAVSIGTYTFVQPNAAKDIVSGLKRYMKKRKINKLKTMIGSMHE